MYKDQKTYTTSVSFIYYTSVDFEFGVGTIKKSF